MFALVVIALWRLVHSPFGRILTAIKQNETRAAFVGYNVWLYKWLAFTVSAAVAGVAGGLFALAQQSAYPNVMSLHSSGFVVMMVLVGGGLVSFWGPVIGALFFILARDLLGAYTETWLLWYGLLFMAMVLWKPDGIAGLWQDWQRRRASHGALASRAARGRTADAALRGKEPAQALRPAGRARRHLARFRRRPPVRDHGPERRRQDDLLQRADRPLSRRIAARSSSPASPSPASRRGRSRARASRGRSR